MVAHRLVVGGGCHGEQKLVDTMLTSDLIYFSNQPNNLCIVS
jgi:hypothetical protein